MISEFPLLTRRWQAGRLVETIAALNTAELAIEYRRFRETAPRRHERGKKYFVGHSGSTPGGSVSNRREEHLARALCNEGAHLPWSSGGSVRLLDYQVPLKARQDDAGIGKLDLLGVTEEGRLVVIELKVDGANGGQSDPPPAALMEALRYAAIVEKNHAIIAKEAKAEFKVSVSDNLPPAILLLGTNAWWEAWKTRSAGSWTAGFLRLLNCIEHEFGIPVECLAIEDDTLDPSPERQFASVTWRGSAEAVQ